MALLVLVNLYLKFFFTMAPLALDENAPAFCIRGVLYFLFVSTEGAFYLFSIHLSLLPLQETLFSSLPEMHLDLPRKQLSPVFFSIRFESGAVLA